MEQAPAAVMAPVVVLAVVLAEAPAVVPAVALAVAPAVAPAVALVEEDIEILDMIAHQL